jgi:hypothetical protein
MGGKRITVRVHFIGGDSLVSTINATEPEVRRYYAIGSQLNVGRGEHDHFETIKGVEIIEKGARE